MAALAAGYTKRQGEIDKASEGLRSDRDQAIRAAYHEGLTMADIADVLGMSHQRVSQIVRS